MSASFLSGFMEVVQQPDKPPTCGSQKKNIIYAMDRRCQPGLSTACIISFFFFFETKNYLASL